VAVRVLTALSVFGGRPHLIKGEAVNRAFHGSKDVRHVTLETWLAEYSDYPRSGNDDFELPPAADVIRTDSRDVALREMSRAFQNIGPDVVLLYGDLDLTLVGLEVAMHHGLPVVHIESGYRSGDLDDPEERTRIEVDRLAVHRIVFSDYMAQNLSREGFSTSSYSRYDNPAWLSLAARLPRIQDGAAKRESPPTGLATLHHDENLLDANRVTLFLNQLQYVAKSYHLTFILYQRTRTGLARLGLLDRLSELSVEVVSTMSYDSYVRHLARASFVVTDSSGLQDDCQFLRKPCFVARRATSRREPTTPVIELIGERQPEDVVTMVEAALLTDSGQATGPPRLDRSYDESFLELLRRLG